MANLKFIYLITFMLFQHSAFFSQLSNWSFDKQQGYWSVGTQYGNAYQWSDVDSEVNGWGTGITVSKNLLYDENSWLGLDMRSSLFYGASRGLDGDVNPNVEMNEAINGQHTWNYLENPEYKFFNNYKNNLFSLDIGANILLNRWRKDTGWYLSLFGGGGLGVYNTRMNLSDEIGSYAERFSTVNQNASRKDIKNELRAILDDSYESRADGYFNQALHAGFMPQAGFEIGFDISRFLTIYLGHKTTFSLTDKLDGQSHGNPNNDILNFTHIGIQLNFVKDPKSSYSYLINRDIETSPATSKYEYPRVKIIQPEVDWYRSGNAEIEVVAKIQNVYSVLDVSCLVNGQEVAFKYNEQEIRFMASLQRGTNVLKIQVSNDQGEARDIKRVIFTPSEKITSQREKNNAIPTIELSSPDEEEIYSEEDIYTIHAFVENVDSKEDIMLTANGMSLTSFKFDPDFGTLSLKVRLANGKNKFQLSAFNTIGKTESSFTIIYGEDQQEKVMEEKKGSVDSDSFDSTDEIKYNESAVPGGPEISFILPYESPFYTRDEDIFLKVNIDGIGGKEDITFTINDIENHFYNFDEVSGMLTDDIQLMELNTVITISAENEYGRQSETLTVIYGDKPIDAFDEIQAVIQFEEIGRPDEDCLLHFEVSIDADIRKSDIGLKMNDYEIRNFMYNREEQLMRFSLYLDEGNNDIEVTAHLDDQIFQAMYNVYCGLENTDPVKTEKEPEIDRSPAQILSVIPESDFTSEENFVILRVGVQNIQNKDQIQLYLNDERIRDFDFDVIKSEVQVLLSLIPEENIIDISVRNDFGIDEKVLYYFYNEPFRTAPSVVINSPRNGFTTDEESIIFRASVDFIKSIDDIQVFFNEQPFTDFNYNEEYGKIQSILPLSLGSNSLEVIAKNKIGESKEKVVFKYRIEHVPAVKITSPKEGLEYRKSFAILTGIVQNMKDKRGIGIQINGKAFTSINYDKAKETVTARLVLEKGDNLVVLSAKSEFGFDSDTTHIFFRGAPEKPSITILNPVDDKQKVSSSSFSLEAQVMEISHSSHVNITVNGRSFEDIYYYKDKKLVKAEIPLIKGYNTIVIVASNETGNTRVSTRIYYQ